MRRKHMIVTLEDGTRYEISADERKFRIAPSEEWTRTYSVDAHPLAYSERKLYANYVGYTYPKAGLYLTILTAGGSVEPDSKIASVVL